MEHIKFSNKLFVLAYQAAGCGGFKPPPGTSLNPILSDIPDTLVNGPVWTQEYIKSGLGLLTFAQSHCIWTSCELQR